MAARSPARARISTEVGTGRQRLSLLGIVRQRPRRVHAENAQHHQNGQCQREHGAARSHPSRQPDRHGDEPAEEGDDDHRLHQLDLSFQRLKAPAEDGDGLVTAATATSIRK